MLRQAGEQHAAQLTDGGFPQAAVTKIADRAEYTCLQPTAVQRFLGRVGYKGTYSPPPLNSFHHANRGLPFSKWAEDLAFVFLVLQP